MPVPLAGEYIAGNALLAWLQIFQQMMNRPLISFWVSEKAS